MEEPIRINFYDIALMGAALGFLVGLIPLVLGILKKKAKYGVIGLIGSTIGGGLLGLFLSVPIVGICIWLILRKEVDIVPEESSEVENSANDSDNSNAETSPESDKS